MTKDQYLKHVEEAYKKVGEAVTTVGLYLTPPFAGTELTGAMAEEVRDDLRDIEERIRELYQKESQVDRW